MDFSNSNLFAYQKLPLEICETIVSFISDCEALKLRCAFPKSKFIFVKRIQRLTTDILVSKFFDNDSLLSLETWELLDVFLEYPELCYGLRSIKIQPDSSCQKWLRKSSSRKRSTPARKRAQDHLARYIKLFIKDTKSLRTFYYDVSTSRDDIIFNLPDTIIDLKISGKLLGVQKPATPQRLNMTVSTSMDLYWVAEIIPHLLILVLVKSAGVSDGPEWNFSRNQPYPLDTLVLKDFDMNQWPLSIFPSLECLIMIDCANSSRALFQILTTAPQPPLQTISVSVELAEWKTYDFGRLTIPLHLRKLQLDFVGEGMNYEDTLPAMPELSKLWIRTDRCKKNGPEDIYHLLETVARKYVKLRDLVLHIDDRQSQSKHLDERVHFPSLEILSVLGIDGVSRKNRIKLITQLACSIAEASRSIKLVAQPHVWEARRDTIDLHCSPKINYLGEIGARYAEF
jgi:hypothetical protein